MDKLGECESMNCKLTFRGFECNHLRRMGKCPVFVEFCREYNCDYRIFSRTCYEHIFTELCPRYETKIGVTNKCPCCGKDGCGTVFDHPRLYSYCDICKTEFKKEDLTYKRKTKE